MSSARIATPRRALWLMLAVTTLLPACATPPKDWVARSTLRGPYLDAELVLRGGEWRFLAPVTPVCGRVLRPEAIIASHTRRGLFGRLRSREGEICDPVGVGTLHRWRRGRQEGEMKPRAPADWRILFEDEDAFVLRGRFPLVARLGVPNASDVVVLVPNDEVCKPITRSRSANLVFRQSGRQVLSLGRCPVIGVAIPPGASLPETAPEPAEEM